MNQQQRKYAITRIVGITATRIDKVIRQVAEMDDAGKKERTLSATDFFNADGTLAPTAIWLGVDNLGDEKYGPQLTNAFDVDQMRVNKTAAYVAAGGTSKPVNYSNVQYTLNGVGMYRTTSTAGQAQIKVLVDLANDAFDTIMLGDSEEALAIINNF